MNITLKIVQTMGRKLRFSESLFQIYESNMAYFSNCGDQLLEYSFFCSKCGNKTVKSIEENVSKPLDEREAAFAKKGQEFEKAFL